MAGLIDYSRRNRRRATTPTASDGADSATTEEEQEVLQSESSAREGGTDAYETGSTPSGGPYENTAYTEPSSEMTPTEQEYPPANRNNRNINVEHVSAAGRDDEYRQQMEESEMGGGDTFQGDGEFFDPEFPSYQQEGPLEMPFFDHVVVDYGEMGIVGKTRLMVRQSLSFGLTLGALGLVLVLAFASYLNPMKKSPARAQPDKEYERRMTGERLSGRPEYYAEYWGYNCDIHDIITEGGWILKAHRISDPRRPGPPGHPVILQHGILCNSSHFFMCEERSMAFWLVDQGYDVWVTNIRENFRAGHTEFTRNDPRYWAWGLKELAFDLRDVIEFICGATGKPRVAYVGHSQGSGSMYLALSPGICPEIGQRLTCFVALGPSVYAGPVLRKFPFSLLRTFRGRKWWSLVFGVKEFIPAISLFHRYLPAFIFGHLGFVIFAYLFGFHDHNWVRRQKPKIFRSLPVATSSELLYWYMASFSHRGCIFDPRMAQPWFPQTFPRHSIVYGDIDYLVLGKPLVQRVERYERNLDIVHAVELEGYEHLDMIFGVDAIRTCFPVIKDTIESSLAPDERNQEMMEATTTDGRTTDYQTEFTSTGYGEESSRGGGRNGRRDYYADEDDEDETEITSQTGTDTGTSYTGTNRARRAAARKLNGGGGGGGGSRRRYADTETATTMTNTTGRAY